MSNKKWIKLAVHSEIIFLGFPVAECKNPYIDKKALSGIHEMLYNIFFIPHSHMFGWEISLPMNIYTLHCLSL